MQTNKQSRQTMQSLSFSISLQYPRLFRSPHWSCQNSGAPRLTFLLCQSVSQLCKVQLCAAQAEEFLQLKILNRQTELTAPLFSQLTLFTHLSPAPNKVNDQLKKRQTKKGIEASPWRIQA